MGYWAGDVNLCRYVRNMPIDLADAIGLKPTQVGVVNLQWLISRAEEAEKKYFGYTHGGRQVHLDRLVDWVVSDGSYEYLYIGSSDEYIDLVHFVRSASFQRTPDSIVWGLGVCVEGLQFSGMIGYCRPGFGASTYIEHFSREDIRSNELGIDFQNFWHPERQMSHFPML